MGRFSYMKQVNKLIIIFLLIVIALLGYAYFAGKNLETKAYTGLNHIKEVMLTLESAGKEGDVPSYPNVTAMYETNGNKIDTLYENSDLIAKVTLKNRSQKINTICSEVEVLDVYKGDMNIKETKIQMYEPFRIEHGISEEDLLYVFGACLPMRTQEEYIVFLRREDNGNYNLVSGLYGKYHIKEDAYLTTDGNNISVDMILHHDMIDFKMSDLKKRQYNQEIMAGSLSEEMALDALDSFSVLEKLKETRANIRSQFSAYGIAS